jgi:hypothetical protein
MRRGLIKELERRAAREHAGRKKTALKTSAVYDTGAAPDRVAKTATLPNAAPGRVAKKLRLCLTGRPRRMEGALDVRYRSGRWKTLRARLISERKQCEGECRGYHPARYAHHTTSIKDDPSDRNFFDEAGIQVLCPGCHSYATTVEKAKRAGKPIPRRQTAAVRGCDVDGNPLDPNHGWYVGVNS